MQELLMERRVSSVHLALVILSLSVSWSASVLIWTCQTGRVRQLFSLPRRKTRCRSWNSCWKLGSDPNRCNICGASPLIVASLAGHVKVVRLLVDAGVDLDSPTFNSQGFFVCKGLIGVGIVMSV